jgi:DNA-binding NarL/FixJ family response regulator
MVEELSRANPAVLVLVMTSIEGTEVRERFLGAGANEVIPKSSSFAEVLAAVRRLGQDGAEEM